MVNNINLIIGSYQWADGSKYSGEWAENELHGYVKLNCLK